jgi:hypothetical protein
MMVLTEQRQQLHGRQQNNEALASRSTVAATLLEQLRGRVENADPQTRRELVEALVDRIHVETVEEKGKLVPRITITYCFEPANFRNSTNRKVFLIRR